ncbi:MAG: hypothetical protein H7A20_09345 [Rhodanobacteraceae bacterium]|nr:hypothetical protein [Xanthomonadales bacterium]MCP5478968.1 hypothetical protein [Rhodanobacteraceae bacterium]
MSLAAPGSVLAASIWSVESPQEYLALIDSDGDGRVSLREYQDYLGRSAREMDRNGDGLLSANELPPGTRSRGGRPVNLQRQREAFATRFHLQDRNGDRYLDAEELGAPPR